MLIQPACKVNKYFLNCLILTILSNQEYHINFQLSLWFNVDKLHGFKTLCLTSAALTYARPRTMTEQKIINSIMFEFVYNTL